MMGQENAVKAEARAKYSQAIGQATRVLLENLENAIKVFKAQTVQARKEYDETIEKHRKGWTPPAGAKMNHSGKGGSHG